MVIGEDDTDNDFSGDDDKSYQPSYNDPNESQLSQDDEAFFDLAKKMEAERVAKLSQNMAISPDSSIIHVMPEGDEIPEDEEWGIDRWLRLQNEEEQSARGRLTAPSAELTKRTTLKSSENKVDELRARQVQLVDQQINLQKAKERLMLTKAQRVCAELEQQRIEKEL